MDPRTKFGDDGLLIADVQPAYPPENAEGIRRLAKSMRSAATVERHHERMTPFQRQLGLQSL